MKVEMADKPHGCGLFSGNWIGWTKGYRNENGKISRGSIGEGMKSYIWEEQPHTQVRGRDKITRKQLRFTRTLRSSTI